ncbi:MAG: sulfite exporter TauE/SafE family protein [Chloroflexota bacterium]
METLIQDNFAWALLISSIIIFAAFFIRSLTGFGSALVSVPLLALFFDLRFVVPLEAMLEIVLSIMLLRSVYRDISKTTLVPLILGAIVGSLVGTYILSAFTDILLKRLLGLVVIVFALNHLRGGANKQTKDIAVGWGAVAGVIGGIFGGLFGASGPPYVLYLTQKLAHKSVLRASLIGLFTFDYGWRVVIFTATGLIDTQMILFGLYLIPALALGAFLGHRVHFQISEVRFKQIVSGVLICSGLLLLWQ